MTTNECLTQDDLLAVLDESLDPSRLPTVELHLESCTTCRGALEQLAGDCSIPDEGEIVPPSESLSHVINRVSIDTGKSEEATLQSSSVTPPDGHLSYDFLEPSSNPDAIGALGAYEIMSVLGQGGMGVVFSARDRRLDRDVAIKIAHQRFVTKTDEQLRFQREAKAIANLNHPNIVLLYTIEEYKGLTFLVMELVKGSSLFTKLEKSNTLTVEEAIHIARSIAEALHASHSIDIIHRDIKPANILIDDATNTVKVTDFGIAKPLEEESVTRPGVLVGTPEYMSPEQVSGRHLTVRSDLFCLGVILHRMLSGKSPFLRNSPFETMNAVSRFKPKRLDKLNPDVPIWIADLVESLLSKSVNDRIGSALEIIEIFKQASQQEDFRPPVPIKSKIAKGSADPIVEPPPSDSVFQQPVFRYSVLGLIGLMVILITAIAFLASRGKGDTSSSDNRTEDVNEEVAPEAKHFQLVGSNQRFATLSEAVASGGAEMEILIDSSGLVPIDGIRLVDQKLTLRANPTIKPILVPKTTNTEFAFRCSGENAQLKIIGIDVQWKLEDIRIDDFQTLTEHSVIHSDGVPVEIVQSRITTDHGSCLGLQSCDVSIIDSHLLSTFGPNIVWFPNDDRTIQVHNSVLESATAGMVVNGYQENSNDLTASVKVASSYILSPRAVVLAIETPLREIEFMFDSNVFDVDEFVRISPRSMQAGRILNVRQLRRSMTNKFMFLHAQNTYGPSITYMVLGRMRGAQVQEVIIESHEDWFRMYAPADENSVKLEEPIEGIEPNPALVDKWPQLNLHRLYSDISHGPSFERIGPFEPVPVDAHPASHLDN